MPSILNNVTAMSASRQLGVTQMGLKQAIERLTTGKRINRASDDAAGMNAANTAESAARTAGASVKAWQADYFNLSAADSYLEEATQLAYRMAELEGAGSQALAGKSEYDALIVLIGTTKTSADNAVLGTTKSGTVTLNTAATTSSVTLGLIQTDRQMLAGLMATAKTSANVKGIEAENSYAISDTWMGADIGAEMVNLTKYQIMMQAGTSALSNANQASQTVLGLFR